VHIFHAIPHARLSMVGPYTILMLISRGMVGYHPTTIINKLCRFTGPHKSGMWPVHNQMLVQGCTMNGLQSTKVGLPSWSLEYPHSSPRPSHPMILPFPLVAPPSLKFKSTFQSFQFLAILIPLEVKRVLRVSRTNHSYSTVS
jgi:hypothetical protein